MACKQCGYIKYINPLPVAGVVVADKNSSGDTRILLVRRGIEPRVGFWTIPGGFVEAHESLMQGAEREALEEAECNVKATSLLALLDVPRISQTMAWFRAGFADATPAESLAVVGPVSQDQDHRFAAGHETQEAVLFPVQDLPWDTLAFPATRIALETYLHDPRPNGSTLYQVVTEMPEGI